MESLVLGVLVILGAGMGSFVACLVRRMEWRVAGGRKLGKRSECLSCGYQLRIRDNIPIMSWLWLGGKCRRCKKKIGGMEILAEVVGGMCFGVLGWSLEVSKMMENYNLGKVNNGEMWYFGVNLGLFLGFGVVLMALAWYDGRNGKMPLNWLRMAILLAGLRVGLKILVEGWNGLESWGWGLVLGVLILGGTYWGLYKLSKEKWVGSGDYLLGVGIALMLADWWLALMTLFLGNLLASVYGLTIGKKKMVHMAPWLGLAFVIVWCFRVEFLKLLV